MTCGNTTGILQKKTMWFIGVEVEQEASAHPLKKILDPPLFSVLFSSANLGYCFLQLSVGLINLNRESKNEMIVKMAY